MHLVDEKFLTQELYITVSTEQTNSLHIHKVFTLKCTDSGRTDTLAANDA